MCRPPNTIHVSPMARIAQSGGARPRDWTIVGLRPYRPSGLVRGRSWARRPHHNYGHGGAGITLSWERRTCGGGGGEVGGSRLCGAGCGSRLSTARLLQLRGTSTITQGVSPLVNRTSRGLWDPVTVYERPRIIRVSTASSRKRAGLPFGATITGRDLTVCNGSPTSRYDVPGRHRPPRVLMLRAGTLSRAKQ